MGQTLLRSLEPKNTISSNSYLCIRILSVSAKAATTIVKYHPNHQMLLHDISSFGCTIGRDCQQRKSIEYKYSSY